MPQIQFTVVTITSVVDIPTCLCVLISTIDFCRHMSSSFFVFFHLKQDLVLNFIFLSHHILPLISHPNPIDILPRTTSTIQALTPFFQGFVYILIKLTCNVCVIASLFVFVGRNQHFHHFTIAKELPTNSDQGGRYTARSEGEQEEYTMFPILDTISTWSMINTLVLILLY